MKKLLFAAILVASASSAMAIKNGTSCSIKCADGMHASCAITNTGCTCICSH